MVDLRAINKEQFANAKRLWGYATAVKMIVFGLGAWAVFLGTPPQYLPQAILILAIVSELLQLRSDGWKSRAEGLLRTLDICRSFGREISEADKRDVVLGAPRKLRKQVSEEQIDDSYFASTKPPGPQRAIENLAESAWYTRQQAATMAGLYATMIVGLLVLSVAALSVAIREADDVFVREQVVRVVTGWLMLIVSLNMLKAAWSYFRMHQRCKATEQACEYLVRGEVSEADALKQWYEYQVARAASPLIPDWLWRIRGESLDYAWRQAKS